MAIVGSDCSDGGQSCVTEAELAVAGPLESITLTITVDTTAPNELR